MISCQLLTLLLGSFEGGGTSFWHESIDRGDAEPDHNMIHINPPRGTAVLFHGNVQHAGRNVLSGIWHLYVASFSLH